MGQIFRITFEKKDYAVELLNLHPISKDTKHIDILLDGLAFRLVKSDANWIFENIQDLYLVKLSIAIGKSISLRYRI